MPDTLVNDSIDLNDKGDYLVLKVIPIGNLLLNSYQNNLDASIPVKALVYIKKKMVGFNIKNKKPIELKLRLDLHTNLSLDEKFDLSTTCKIQKVQWIEEPKLRVAGIKINLKKTIEKQIKKNEATIEAAICQAIDKAVPIQKEVAAIWKLLNETHRVAKHPIDIWLTTVPRDFSAKFEKKTKDTLRVILQAKTGLLITPLKSITLKDTTSLPANKNFEINNGIDLKVSINMPYEYMDLIISSQLEGKKIEYAGLSAELTGFKTKTDSDQLRLEFKTRGDVDLDLMAMSKLSLTKDKTLEFRDLSYQVDSNNPIVNSVDWLSNSSIDSYLLKYTKVPLSHILDSLDSKIVRALDRSNLSSKIALDLSFNNIKSDSIIYYDDRFEWIFSINGEAHAYLSDSLVIKK